MARTLAELDRRLQQAESAARWAERLRPRIRPAPAIRRGGTGDLVGLIDLELEAGIFSTYGWPPQSSEANMTTAACAELAEAPSPAFINGERHAPPEVTRAPMARRGAGRRVTRERVETADGATCVARDAQPPLLWMHEAGAAASRRSPRSSWPLLPKRRATISRPASVSRREGPGPPDRARARAHARLRLDRSLHARRGA